MKPRIAIVGAGGFVGWRMVEMATLRRTVEIIPIVRSLSGAARLARFGVDCRIGDANTLEGIASAIADCDVVVNLTAGDSRRLVAQLRNIHAACERHAVARLVHVSSAVVFGEVLQAPGDDGAAQEPARGTLYAREKARAERFVESTRGRTAVITLRPGLIWGPRSPWVVGPLTALSEGTAFLVERGSGICNLIYIDNLIESVLAAARQTSPESGFYNVSDDRIMTWREYYGALASLIGHGIDDMPEFADGPFRPTLASRVQDLKETWWFDVLKRRLSSHTKLRLKQAFGDFHVKISTPGARSRLVITRDMWTLQRTRYALPTGRFLAAFGHCNRVDFETALSRTAQWAAYAGFTGMDSPFIEKSAHVRVGPSIQEASAAATLV